MYHKTRVQALGELIRIYSKIEKALLIAIFVVGELILKEGVTKREASLLQILRQDLSRVKREWVIRTK